MSDDAAVSEGPPITFPSPGFLEDVARLVAPPIFVKDRDFRVVWVNDAMCALVGHSRKVLLGKSDHDLYTTEQADSFALQDREVFERGRQLVIEEERFTDSAGRVHVVTTTKIPLRDAGGAVTHLIGVIHDITRIKAVEEALRVANEELEGRVEERTRALRDAQHALLRKERLAVLGQLSGGLAHQIRTPLSTISNAAAVLRRRLDGATDPDTRAAIAIIDEEVWEANRIITDLLDFVRVRPPSRSPVAVSSLIDSALSAVRAPDRVSVVRHVPPELLAWVDERQTRDALGNLIRNAFEAMGEEGRLTLRASSCPPYASIAVEDTGPGVAEEALVHLFEPLVTTKALGLGLGLTTARALIENQKGELRYVQPGHLGGDPQPPGREGACFEIRIPLAAVEGI